MAASSAQQRIETRMTRQPGLTTQRGARGGIALVADRPLFAGFSDACMPGHASLALGGVREASRHEIA
jgi:hypothetical protein